MEHDAPSHHALQDGGAVDDWAARDDVEPSHRYGADAAAPSAPPAEGVNDIQSSLQSLELKTDAVAHEDVQMVADEAEETKRHLNVVFIGHVDKHTSLDNSSDMASQKKSSVSLICQENKKRRKVHKPEVFTAEGKGNVDKYDDTKLSERDEFLNSELQRVSRSEQIMKNLVRALWAVSKQKLLESESAAKSMKELLSEKDIQIIELKKELNDLKSCSHEKLPVAEDTSFEQNDAVSLGQAAPIPWI